MFLDSIEISKNAPPVVVAEIGINHNGSLSIAKEMVDAAHRAGIKVIKHQTHIIESEMSTQAKKVIPGNAKKSIYEIMSECALDEENEYELKKYIESKNMIFISTPFSKEAALRLQRFDTVGYKIGSGEMNNFPLIKLVASFKKPLIISTGMNDIATIKRLTSLLDSMNAQYALMHTTNLYPTKPEFVRLGAMEEMMRTFPNIPIGLSDHTLNNNACNAAVALGASILERHFTDRMDRSGPDIICSMDEIAAKELMQSSYEIFLMRGGKKEALKEEKVTIDFAFATCVLIKDIKKGQTFSLDNLWVKRPFVKDAIKAEFFESVLGKKATMDLSKDTHILPSMVSQYL